MHVGGRPALQLISVAHPPEVRSGLVAPIHALIVPNGCHIPVAGYGIISGA